MQTTCPVTGTTDRAANFLASVAAEAKVEAERRRPVSLRDPSAIPYQIGFAAGVRWLSGKIGPDELERILNG